MIRSIRLRLQFWYALVMVSAVGGFGIYLFLQIRSSGYAELDAELTASANYIDVSIKSFPPHIRDGKEKDREFGPPPKPVPPDQDLKDFKDLRDFKDDREPRPFPFTKDLGKPKKSREELFYEMAPVAWREQNTDGNRFFIVWRPDGSILNCNGLPKDQYPEVFESQAAEPELSDRSPYRLASRRGPARTTILVGINTRQLHQELKTLAWQMVAVGTGIVLVGLIGGWFVTSLIFRPIRRITTTASHISGENLKERIELANLDQELVELAKVLNDTFNRLESAFDLQSRFTADASHELRTPLAVIRSHADLALARQRTEEEYQQALRACQTAADRMTGLVDGLLLLSLADVGRLALRREPVALDRVVAETITFLTPLANSSNISLTTDVLPTTVLGDYRALERVVSNLVANAIHYNQAGGSVRVEVREFADHAILRVIDTGIGIPDAEKENIFKRFHRVDKARSRATGGTGLGLAISRGVIESHGGKIQFESQFGSGTTFTVTLPFQAEESPM